MQGTRYKVLVLGYGEMGHSMQHLLGQRHALRIWQRSARAGGEPIAPESLAAECDVLLFCLPAPPHFDLLNRLLPALSRRTLCLTIAKGLDDSGRTPGEVFEQVLGTDIPNGVMYGPMIAEEIRAGKPAFAQLAVSDPENLHKAMTLFRDTGLHVEASDDRRGIAWSAILKNVYAILFGVADELGLGDNMRGHLAVAALAEIGDIVRHFGGDAATTYRLAGLGDLITTATSAGSHHHELGRLLARGTRTPLHGEGLHTLQVLARTSLVKTDAYPLLRLIGAGVRDPDGLRGCVQDYLAQLDRRATPART